jgi:hypothetical protein
MSRGQAAGQQHGQVEDRVEHVGGATAGDQAERGIQVFIEARKA